MPELPEVETIRRGLDAALRGRRVSSAWVSGTALRKPSPLPLQALAGARVAAIERHAKVMTWRFDDGRVLVSHLGMTGKWLFEDPARPAGPHTHLRLVFDDGTRLRYEDARRFGWLAFHDADAPPRDTAHYGPDALDDGLDEARFARMLAASRTPLKAFLLDQTKVSGLGNIYACEALWRAGLSPRRLACNTPARRVAPLLAAMRGVLNDSLAAGGTSFNDYVDSIGRQGSFLFDVAVFQREGRPCPRCRRETSVRRIVQSGRSTFYCPGCQR